METGMASETAYRAGKARAWHQEVDHPRVFADPFARHFLREEDARALQRSPGRGSPFARAMRMALAVRSRLTEDALDEAVQRGTRQYVVLGAGFDTFALRSTRPPQVLRVFEVDHADTQQAKRARLQETGLPVPPALSFVPMDFATQRLPDALRAAGFDRRQPAFFALLGVTVYLPEDALMRTLSDVAQLGAPGSEIVFDYVVRPSSLPWLDRLALHWAARRCARLGEPWLTFLDPEAVDGKLRALGYRSTQQLGTAALEARLRAEQGLPASSKPPRFGMGRLVKASI